MSLFVPDHIFSWLAELSIYIDGILVKRPSYSFDYDKSATLFTCA